MPRAYQPQYSPCSEEIWNAHLRCTSRYLKIGMGRNRRQQFLSRQIPNALHECCNSDQVVTTRWTHRVSQLDR